MVMRFDGLVKPFEEINTKIFFVNFGKHLKTFLGLKNSKTFFLFKQFAKSGIFFYFFRS